MAFGFVGGVPGAELDPPTATTGADGRAAAVARLGIVSGEQTIVARVLGTDAQPDVRFTATAVGHGRGNDGWGDDDDD